MFCVLKNGWYIFENQYCFYQFKILIEIDVKYYRVIIRSKLIYWYLISMLICCLNQIYTNVEHCCSLCKLDEKEVLYLAISISGRPLWSEVKGCSLFRCLLAAKGEPLRVLRLSSEHSARKEKITCARSNNELSEYVHTDTPTPMWAPDAMLAAVRFDTSPIDDRFGSLHPIKARFYEARASRSRLIKKKREREREREERMTGRNRPGKTSLTKKRVMNYSRL